MPRQQGSLVLAEATRPGDPDHKKLAERHWRAEFSCLSSVFDSPRPGEGVGMEPRASHIPIHPFLVVILRQGLLKSPRAS